MNNFINRGKPIGAPLGSDCYEVSTGINTVFLEKMLFNLVIGVMDSGNNNIIYSPYNPYAFEDYYSDKFPSSYGKRKSFFRINFDFLFKNNLSLFFNTEVSTNDSKKFNKNINFGFNYWLKQKMHIK